VITTREWNMRNCIRLFCPTTSKVIAARRRESIENGGRRVSFSIHSLKLNPPVEKNIYRRFVDEVSRDIPLFPGHITTRARRVWNVTKYVSDASISRYLISRWYVSLPLRFSFSFFSVLFIDEPRHVSDGLCIGLLFHV